MAKGTVLLIGATSDIARAIGDVYAASGYSLILAGRNTEELEQNATDYSIRHEVECQALHLDVCHFEKHQAIIDSLPELAGVICVAGFMVENEDAFTNWQLGKQTVDTNYSGCVSILNLIAATFKERNSGWIVGISSVAGDRGRGSNFMYGSAKAGFTAYLSGLRNYLQPFGVHVLTVKPGFVDTKMTEHLDLPKPLTAQPMQVAKSVFKAQQKGKNILYTLWMWKWVMLIIRNIPEGIFKKLKL
ncbi:MAG: SDR family oxidoreductase [Bacteroidetes bacterium]|nr:SDR family oxidoreductase [Bacteroidota bacterium]